MNNLLQNASYFGLALTLLMYWVGCKINKKTKISLLNPILVASADDYCDPCCLPY